jgi:hypothetical protein
MIPMLFVLAAQVTSEPHPVPFMREIRQGPMPFQERTMSQPHRFSDDRMFPDIAIGALSIDGDTLYVQLTNKGLSATRTNAMIVARAQSNGMVSDLAEARTGRLSPGESRWVPLRGFSVRTASTRATVFSLAGATTISAAVHLIPSSAGALDRSGDGCGECTVEMKDGNNQLTLSGSAIGHGKPQQAPKTCPEGLAPLGARLRN